MITGPLSTVLAAMGIARMLIGIAPIVAPGPASRLMGFPAAHDSPTARLMGRLFGVRDIGLGVLVFYGLRHPETLPFIILFNACMDGGDLASIAVPLVRRQGIDRAAIVSGVFALTGGLSWLVVYAIGW